MYDGVPRNCFFIPATNLCRYGGSCCFPQNVNGSPNENCNTATYTCNYCPNTSKQELLDILNLDLSKASNVSVEHVNLAKQQAKKYLEENF